MNTNRFCTSNKNCLYIETFASLMSLNMQDETVNPPENGWQNTLALKYLPLNLFGVPREHLPRDLLQKRAAALYGLVAEVCFCLVCIPIGAAVRSGILRASVYLNIITLLMGLLGLWASAVLRGLYVSLYVNFATSSYLLSIARFCLQYKR